MQFTTIAAAAAVLAGAFTNAAAVPDVFLEKRCLVAENNQSCTCSDSFNVSGGYGLREYTVIVGSPFEADKCNTVKSKLMETFTGLSDWSCYESGCGWFHIVFEISSNNPSHATIINQNFAELFPAVNGFNCPGY